MASAPRENASATPAQGRRLLVHLASGIGNIIFATPLLVTLARHGDVIDLRLDGDYSGTADLFRGWSGVRAVFDGQSPGPSPETYDLVIPAIPPFYWNRFQRIYHAAKNCVVRPADALFYADEQAYYLQFARTIGCGGEPPYYFVPAAPDDRLGVGAGTVVLAPGCKTGEMAAKRWPHFPALAEAMGGDIVLVGTPDDLRRFDGTAMRFPARVRSLIGQLSLQDTARVLAAAGLVVANDSGLAHLSGALGTPTLALFGPTPDKTLGRFPPNVRVMRTGLPCEPCWFGARFAACGKRVECLEMLGVGAVMRAVAEMRGEIGARPANSRFH